MTDDRADSASGEPSSEAASDGTTDLTTAFLASLPITGLAISVFDNEGSQVTVAASDEVAARLEEIQFDLGDGPHLVALRTGQPVLLPNLNGQYLQLWPAFAAAIQELPRSCPHRAFPLCWPGISAAARSITCMSLASRW